MKLELKRIGNSTCLILPNELTFGAAGLALATSPWRPQGLAGSLLGAATSLALTVVPFVLYKRVRGRSGMGLGDAKLAVVAGAWFGVAGALFVVLAAAVQSGLAALAMRIVGIAPAVPPSVVEELATLRAQAEAGDLEAQALLDDDPMAAEAGNGTVQ